MVNPRNPMEVSSGIQAFSVRLQREVALILVLAAPAVEMTVSVGRFFMGKSRENYGDFMEINWKSIVCGRLSLA